MATEIQAAELLIRNASDKINNLEPMTLESAMCKLFASELCVKISNEAVQIFGGYGYIQEYPLERHVRDVRVHQILEGTNEIMKMIIGRRMIMEDAASIIQ